MCANQTRPRPVWMNVHKHNLHRGMGTPAANGPQRTQTDSNASRVQARSGKWISNAKATRPDGTGPRRGCRQTRRCPQRIWVGPTPCGPSGSAATSVCRGETAAEEGQRKVERPQTAESQMGRRTRSGKVEGRRTRADAREKADRPGPSPTRLGTRSRLSLPGAAGVLTPWVDWFIPLGPTEALTFSPGVRRPRAPGPRPARRRWPIGRATD